MPLLSVKYLISINRQLVYSHQSQIACKHLSILSNGLTDQHVVLGFFFCVISFLIAVEAVVQLVHLTVVKSWEQSEVGPFNVIEALFLSVEVLLAKVRLKVAAANQISQVVSFALVLGHEHALVHLLSFVVGISVDAFL